MDRICRIFLSVFLFFVTSQLKAQQVTISNNLLYDTWLTPNLRVGVRLAPHWSMGVTAGYRPWPTDDHKSQKWKHLLVSPDVRYWTDSVNVHHFFGVNLIYSHYNVADVKFPFGLYKSVRDERRQGDLGALGVYYGYSWSLARHWNIEALIGVAVGYTKYDRYECGECGTKIGDDKKFFAMPQAGLNIVFNLPGRPKKVAQPVEPVEPVIPAVIQPEPEVKTDHVEVVVDSVPADPILLLCEEYPVLADISEYKPYDRSQVLRRDQMEEAIANGDDHAADLQQVIDIVDKEQDLTRREQQIRKLRDGKTYQYIKEHYLGDQRNSGYLRVFYDYQEK